ncbi:hypothetical protein HK405_014633, partial [Cladochytrium tenue]
MQAAVAPATAGPASAAARRVIHTVMWRARPDASPAQLTACVVAAKTLERIDGVLAANLNQSFTSDRSRGYTHLLVVEMRDRETLQRYAPHPLHVAARDDYFRIAFQT